MHINSILWLEYLKKYNSQYSDNDLVSEAICNYLMRMNPQKLSIVLISILFSLFMQLIKGIVQLMLTLVIEENLQQF